ncbi:MAG: MotA/TolQ/ExbB proton channel family protein [Bacteroidales bacterium]|nr:MotA/TolQ/ExbB proton channel family protein [Bacteroidales bacterium]MBN2756560.1 MotA/TolQ/ExbB proton channel family protein [Bacteroidales bacterium]
MFSQIVTKINEGGPFFMVPILLLLILIIILIVKGFLEENKRKTISLISSIGLFTIAWGILGQTVGLVEAFDAVQAAGDISMSILAGGLKVSLLTTVFGIMTFLVSRLGIIALVWVQKENQE